MGPTWVLSAPVGPHVGPMNLAIRGVNEWLHPGAPLLTWINSIPAWISNHMPSEMWDEIINSFPNFNGYRVEVWEWIRNFFPHFIMDVITYPCWD